MRGFCRYLGDVSIIKAEDWAILELVRMATAMGIKKIMLESDSCIVVDAIKEPTNCPVEIHGIVKETIHRLATFDEWRIRHIWREANYCADFMANLGTQRRDAVLEMWADSPLPELKLRLLRDSLGLGFARGER